MKTRCLLFLTMSCAALTPGTGYGVPSSPASERSSPETSSNTARGHLGDTGHAAPANDGKHQTGGKTSDEHRDHGRASATNHLPSGASQTKASHPKRLTNDRQGSRSGNVMDLGPHSSDKFAGVPEGGSVQNKAANIRSTGRPPSVVVRPAVPLVNNAHHRSPNPAIVSGSANVHSRNAGAINGTRMSHKL
jgi:hypothetical protein